MSPPSPATIGMAAVAHRNGVAAELQADVIRVADEASIDAFAARDADEDPAAAPIDRRAKAGRWSRPMIAVAAEVIGFAAGPRWSWGFPTLDREAPVPLGSLVYILGATGRGKSSLLAQIARSHDGPVLVVSAELAAPVFGARLVSQAGHGTWLGVVRGDVDPSVVRAALDVPRMRIADRLASDWRSSMRAEVAAMQAEHPGQVLLAVVDYLQILRVDGRDTRERVAEASTFLRELATETNAVIVAIAKMGRAASRAARDGSAVGVDGTEGGAEAGIEYDAVAQVSLGAMRPADPGDRGGPQVVDVSVNKARFGRGDVVIGFRFDGARGLFRDLGEAISGPDHRQRAAMSNAADKATKRICDELAGRTEPIGRNDLAAALGGKREVILHAIRALVASGVVVTVEPGGDDDRRARPIMLATIARSCGYIPPPPGAPASPWRRP